ncbi:MAG: hypothetical protein ABIG64_00795 [Candidatus Omnitrophota bacterium]
MNGKNNFSIVKIVDIIINIAKKIIGQNYKAILILSLVVILYFFAAVTFKDSLKNPPRSSPSLQHSNLYLIEFINAFREVQQDFVAEDIIFGEKFLNFTLNIKFRTKSIIIVKKLAIDMILGLIEEYPELESIEVKVIKNWGDDTAVIYGTAKYSGNENDIVWDYR